MPTRWEQKERIAAMLGNASASLPGARVHVAINADGTIDGEIFAPIERGEEIEDKLEAMQEILRDQRIPKTWTSVGFRFEPSNRVSIKNDYNRFRGLYQVHTNYYRYAADSIAIVDDIMQGRFEKGKKKAGMRDKGYRKPIHVIVRVHWNVYGIHPPRPKGK